MMRPLTHDEILYAQANRLRTRLSDLTMGWLGNAWLADEYGRYSYTPKQQQLLRLVTRAGYRANRRHNALHGTNRQVRDDSFVTEGNITRRVK